MTDAVVRLVGPSEVPPARVDRTGLRYLQLAPGSWQALVVSPKYGFLARTFEVPEKAEGLIDCTLWIEAEVPHDPTNELTVDDADYMVMNDFDEAFAGDLDRFASRLLTDPRTASTV